MISCFITVGGCIVDPPNGGIVSTTPTMTTYLIIIGFQKVLSLWIKVPMYSSPNTFVILEDKSQE